jgi:hypothetical protein
LAPTLPPSLLLLLLLFTGGKKEVTKIINEMEEKTKGAKKFERMLDNFVITPQL